MDQKTFHQFFYFFHCKRDYYECHELLEFAWKNKQTYRKTDIEVAFILFATAEYHYRRKNIIGAKRCLTKSIHLFKVYQNKLSQFGIKNNFITELETRLQSIDTRPYNSYEIPITKQTFDLIKLAYPDFLFMNVLPNIKIMHKHRYEYLMRNKHPINDAP